MPKMKLCKFESSRKLQEAPSHPADQTMSLKDDDPNFRHSFQERRRIQRGQIPTSIQAEENLADIKGSSSVNYISAASPTSSAKNLVYVGKHPHGITC